MKNLSLLNKDTDSTIKKIKKIIEEKKLEDSKKDDSIKFNKSYDTLGSQLGITNTMRGTNEVLNHQNKFQIKENSMSHIIPIKQIILEFTADHIRDNAGKYAAGTMLGLGATAGYLAGDPEHGSNLLNQVSSHTPTNVSNDHVGTHINDDTTTIKMANGTDRHSNFATGQGTGLGDHLKNWASDRGNVNYHNNVMDAVNDDPSFLSGGEKAGLIGAGVLGVGGAAALAAQRKGFRAKFGRMAGPVNPNGRY